MAAVNPATVVVLAGGARSPPRGSARPARSCTGTSGQAGAGGVLDVLTGAVNPSGRLAETLPVRLADTPTAASFPATGRTAVYREGLYVGYRYYTSADVPVAFPFGFGLSYTTFAHSDLVVDADAGAVDVTVTVTNTGPVAGRTSCRSTCVGRRRACTARTARSRGSRASSSTRASRARSPSPSGTRRSGTGTWRPARGRSRRAPGRCSSAPTSTTSAARDGRARRHGASAHRGRPARAVPHRTRPRRVGRAVRGAPRPTGPDRGVVRGSA